MKRLIYLVSCLSVSVCLLSSCNKGETETAANPANFLRNDAQKAMVSTLKDLADGHIYSVEYSADYCINEYLCLISK